MLEKELSRIELNGVKYPYKCDMVVLEKIQKEYGDIIEFENDILGIVPYYDANDIRVEEKDKYTIPDVEKVCTALVWMIEEGLEISGNDAKAPEIKDIKRQEEYTISELSLIVYNEFGKSFLSKKPGKKRADTKKNEEGKS